MAVRSRDEILEAIKSKIGEAIDDESIALIEDVTDTISDFEEKIKGDGVDWKTKYEENDEAWRKRYLQRFYNSPPEEEEEIATEELEVTKKNFEDLFD